MPLLPLHEIRANALDVVAMLCRNLAANSMYLVNDRVLVHSYIPHSSTGVQMRGGSYPALRHTLSMMLYIVEVIGYRRKEPAKWVTVVGHPRQSTC